MSKSVLVVEDDPSIRSLIQMVLEAEGYHVLTASNGQEGVKILKQGAHPGLILLDLMMPIMNGWEFLRARREDCLSEEIPVIVLSAAGIEVAPDGANGMFSKPFELESLLQITHRYCHSVERAPQAS